MELRNDFDNGHVAIKMRIQDMIEDLIKKMKYWDNLPRMSKQLIDDKKSEYINITRNLFSSQNMSSVEIENVSSQLKSDLELYAKKEWGIVQQKIYKMYIDFCYNWTKKHAEKIKHGLDLDILEIDRSTKYTNTSDLDETLLSKIKIKSVLFADGYSWSNFWTERIFPEVINTLEDKKIPWSVMSDKDDFEKKKAIRLSEKNK